MKRLFALLLALCSSLIGAMDQQSQSQQPFYLITHTNTDCFGKKAIIYVGDINRLTLPQYMESKPMILSGFSVNTNVNYYEAIASHISGKPDNNAHNAIVVEITKEDENEIRNCDHTMTKNLKTKRVFNNKSTEISHIDINSNQKIFRPFWFDTIWFDTIMTYDIHNKRNHVSFLVTDEPTKPIFTVKFLSISTLSILTILLAYLYKAGHMDNFLTTVSQKLGQ